MFAASSMGKTFHKQLMLYFFIVNRRRAAPILKTINRTVSEAIKFSLIMPLNLEKVISTGLLDLSANVSMLASAPGGGIAVDSPQVLQVNQATDFTFTWTPSGLPWFQASDLKFDVFYELMGPGEAIIAVPTFATTGIGVFGVPQTFTMTLPPLAIPPGVYRIVVKMGVTPTGLSTPTAICGFEELGLVEYYTA